MGQAFLFVPLLAAAWIIGLAVAAQAAQYFLAIVESSATPAARNFSWKPPTFREWIRDGVHWPDDTFLDAFARLFYFVYLVGIWAGPAMVLGRWLAGDSPWGTVIAGGAFWLLFPIGLLSSLASASRWTPFWSGVPIAFCKRPGKTLAFYLLSAPILGLIFLTFDLVLLRASTVSVAWSIALAPLAVFAFFVYSRMLGRLGLIVGFATRADDAAARPPVRRANGRKRLKRKYLHAYDPVARQFGPREEIPDDPPANAQPPELAPIDTPYDGPLTGYGVDYSGAVPQEVPRPAPIIHEFDDDDLNPIRALPPVDVENSDRQRLAEKLAEPSQRELDLRVRQRPVEPGNPYGPETLLFFLDTRTIEPWLRLTAGVVLLSLCQRGLDMLRPL